MKEPLKIDLKDIASGVMHQQAIIKIVKELSKLKESELKEEVVVVSEGNDFTIVPSNATHTRLLLEIIGILRNIDANVEKLACQTE
jgi:hypothetical protein